MSAVVNDGDDPAYTAGGRKFHPVRGRDPQARAQAQRCFASRLPKSSRHQAYLVVVLPLSDRRQILIGLRDANWRIHLAPGVVAAMTSHRF